jgi:hypothetical protein
MNEAAREIEVSPPVSLDGLDQIFDTPPTSVQGAEQSTLIRIANADEHGAQAMNSAQCNPDHWTLQTAAEQLRLSVATIRRRLSKCELQGYKVQGVNGPEWRVIPPTQTVSIDQGYPDQFVEHPEQPVISALLTRLSDVESQLTQAQKDLQGANWRNGYLEAQLEAERQQVKLLMDSQHQKKWWHRIRSFFSGQ